MNHLKSNQIKGRGTSPLPLLPGLILVTDVGDAFSAKTGCRKRLADNWFSQSLIKIVFAQLSCFFLSASEKEHQITNKSI